MDCIASTPVALPVRILDCLRWSRCAGTSNWSNIRITGSRSLRANLLLCSAGHVEDMPVCIPLNRRYLGHRFQDLFLLPPNILRCRGWIISSVRSLPHPDLPCLVFLLICSTLIDPLLQPRAVNHLSIAFQFFRDPAARSRRAPFGRIQIRIASAERRIAIVEEGASVA